MDSRGLKLELDNIFLLNCSKLSDKVGIKKLPLADKELNAIKEEDILMGIKKTIILPAWVSKAEGLSKTKKYYVAYKDQTYHINILSYLDANLNAKVKDVLNIRSIFWNQTPQFNSILYLFKDEKSKEKRIYLFRLTKSIRLEDKTIISIKVRSIQKSIKAKLPTTNLNPLTVDKINNGITLPMDKCVSCFYINNKDITKSRVEVYDAFVFDELFSTSQTQNKYAVMTVDNFQKENWRIAQNIVTVSKKSVCKDEGVAVKFEGRSDTAKKVDLINKTIQTSESVRKPLADYTDNVKRTIKRIGPKELARLITELNNAVDDENIKVNFEKNNIPKIDLKHKILKVTPDSLPIFSAMLENKVIEKLLSHEISIPYYEATKEGVLGIYSDINWSDKN